MTTGIRTAMRDDGRRLDSGSFAGLLKAKIEVAQLGETPTRPEARPDVQRGKASAA